MKTPQKVLETITRAVAEEVDYSQLTEQDLPKIAESIRNAELALHAIMEQSRATVRSNSFDLFVDIANGK